MSNINLKNCRQTESDKETAEELCRYFSEVFVKEEAWKKDEGGKTSSVNSISVTDEAVYKALNKLKPDKSPRPDNIHPKLLYEVAAEVVRPLTLLFQKSISEGKLPSDWKTANITAIYKPESPAVAGKPARRLRKVCTVYVRAVGL